PTGVFVFRGMAITPAPMPSLAEGSAAQQSPYGYAPEKTTSKSGASGSSVEEENDGHETAAESIKLTKREVVVLDMSQPQAMFLARSFTIQPHDVIYVTNAPIYQFGKIISLVLQTGGLANNAKGFSTTFAGP